MPKTRSLPSTPHLEKLKKQAKTLRERAEKFLDWASHHEPGRRAAAAGLLGEYPEIASFDVYTAAACAEVEALGKFLNEDPGRAIESSRSLPACGFPTRGEEKGRRAARISRRWAR